MAESKHEEKQSESKTGDTSGSRAVANLFKNRDLVEELFPFYQAQISVGLEEFYDKYLHEFDPDDEEHKLEYTEIFHKFEQLFEGFLSDFILERNLEEGEFYKELRQAARASNKNEMLVKLITAQTDYTFFVELMRTKAKERRQCVGESKS